MLINFLFATASVLCPACVFMWTNRSLTSTYLTAALRTVFKSYVCKTYLVTQLQLQKDTIVQGTSILLTSSICTYLILAVQGMEQTDPTIHMPELQDELIGNCYLLGGQS